MGLSPTFVAWGLIAGCVTIKIVSMSRYGKEGAMPQDPRRTAIICMICLSPHAVTEKPLGSRMPTWSPTP